MIKRGLHTKKILSAILSAAMIATVLPVGVMADEIIDEVEAIEEAAPVEESVIVQDEELAKVREITYVNGLYNAWDPNGGMFDGEKLLNEGNAYRGYVGVPVEGTTKFSYEFDENDKIIEYIDNEPKLKEGIFLGATLYYRYFENSSLPGTYACQVGDFKNLVPTRDGYKFAGWFYYDEDERKMAKTCFKPHDFTDEELGNSIYKALWAKTGVALPDIKAEDVTISTDNVKTAAVKIKVDKSIFEDYGFNDSVEDLYIMFKIRKAGENDFSWTRWGNGDWVTPIDSEVDEVVFSLDYLFEEEPALTDTDVQVDMFYISCAEGSELTERWYYNSDNWAKIGRNSAKEYTIKTTVKGAEKKVEPTKVEEKVTLDDGTKVAVILDVKDADGNPLVGDISNKLVDAGKKIKLPGKKDMPEIKGYTFKRWKSNNKKVSSIKKSQLKDGMNITAEYVENTYTIQYKLDKPKGSKVNTKVKPAKVAYNEKVKLASGLTATDKDGKIYTLLGWAKAKGSTTVDYKPDEEINRLAGETKKDKKIVLYPVWSK